MEFQIDIDGYIGQYGYSKQYVRSMLEQNKGKAINVRINSLGGSLDDALDMAARFNEHGNVTAYLYGYCASAATVASLGATKVVIDANAFYLAHKVMNWVDLWGLMNADEMQKTIEELEANKKDNDKMDLVLAKMYAKKCKRKCDEIMAVLKEGAWLNAEEAKEIGFVDEISNGINYKGQTIEAKLNALGLPLPVREQARQKNFMESFKNLINKSSQMKKDYLNLNALLQVEGFEAKDNVVNMSTEQLTTIDNKLKANADEIKALQEKESEKDNRIAELEKRIAEFENQASEETKQIDNSEEDVTAISMYNQVKNLI